MWFPKIDKLAEDTVKKCLACQACVASTQRPEPIESGVLPSEPGNEVSVDFLSGLPTNDYLLVVMDDYSRFPEVEIVGSTSAKTVIPKLDLIFTHQGIPVVVKSDNGPPFNSDDFRNFAHHLGFTHRKVTPLWPQANGEVEHFMGPLMKMIRAAYMLNQGAGNKNFTGISGSIEPHPMSPLEYHLLKLYTVANWQKRTTLLSLSQPLLDRQAVHEKVKVTDRLYKDKAKS